VSNNFSLYIKDEKLTEVQKVKKRQELIASLPKVNLKELFDINFPVEKAGSNNCENMIGSVEIPLGLVGPVSVKGFKNSIFIPLATTEGALVASINRGCKALNLSKNLSVVIKKVGMARALVFKCESTVLAHEFVNWMEDNKKVFVEYCEETSNHLKFISYKSFIRGRHAYLRFSFDTDEAMGMNMVTIALKYAWDKIKKNHPKVKLLSLSGNVCTDKKDSVLNRMFGRGFNVELEVFLSKEILKSIFNVTAKDLVKSHVAKNLVGSNVAGSMAQNMHVANALSAFYIATGQDPAHTVGGSEASVTFEEENEGKYKGGLYAALTLPTVSVGSVGGGTWLPKQTQARSLVLLGGSKSIGITRVDEVDKNDNSKKLVDSKTLALAAGIAAFAGEISGLSALTNQSLADSHQKLGRGFCE
jgi:hydroxymethylglutaryl-CoA reductase (NADPH)